VTAMLLNAERSHDEALSRAEQVLGWRGELGIRNEGIRLAFLVAMDAALALGNREKMESLLEIIEALPLRQPSRHLLGLAARYRARVAALDGLADHVEPGFRAAVGRFREIENPFLLAATLLEHGEWLVEQGRGEEATPLLDEARSTFEDLQARPWLERAVRAGVPADRTQAVRA
jgi:hypothetical protein